MFHNIFTKKQATGHEAKKSRIIIDNREKNSLVPSELSRLGFNMEFQQLQVGDYLIKGIPIERKTISDLKSSIINKRIFEQMHNLKKNHGILLIEGIENEDIYKGAMHENALRGFFLFLTTDNQVPFIFTKNENDTAKYLAVLEKRKSNASMPLRQTRIFKSRSEQLQFILEGFPNIGPAKAQALLDKFKSIKNIINASENDLKPILGIKTKDFLALIN